MRWTYLIKFLGRASLMIGSILTCGFLLIQQHGQRNRAKGPFRAPENNTIEAPKVPTPISESDSAAVPNVAEISDGGWGDSGKIRQYNERFWYLMNSTGRRVEGGVGSGALFKGTPLPYLWRPLHSSITKDSPRIVPQLVWAMEEDPAPSSVGTILLWEPFSWWNKGEWSGGRELVPGDCEISAGGKISSGGSGCRVTDDRGEVGKASAIVSVRDSFHTGSVGEGMREGALRFYFILESPFHSWAYLKRDQDLLASYWRGSDIVTPYATWVYYNEDVRALPQDKDYSVGKSKVAAAFISNCDAWNDRVGYIEQLREYIQVDVYGACGEHRCGRESAEDCFRLLKENYFFYLSFENSNCRDYITEKLFTNALQNDVVPVVMGASRDDYATMAPTHSYLHVEDYPSPKELALHLIHLTQNPQHYNSYFQWKGTGEFISSSLFCRICAMLHYSTLRPPPKRTKPWRWAHTEAIHQGICLPKGRWYWGRDNHNYTVH